MADYTFSNVRQYRDISLTFARNPVTRDIVVVTGAEAVKRSVKNLLYTMAGELPFTPNFGSTLHHILFEPVDAITILNLEDAIRACIAAFEPRVTIKSLDIVPRDDELGYHVHLTMVLVNLPQPATLSVFLRRLR